MPYGAILLEANSGRIKNKQGTWPHMGSSCDQNPTNGEFLKQSLVKSEAKNHQNLQSFAINTNHPFDEDFNGKVLQPVDG